jgi:hypothetical protein
MGFLSLLLIIVLGVVYFSRHPDAASRARFLKRAGYGSMAFAIIFFALFVIGQSVSDPGGSAAPVS